jgi:hypothetical protein
MSNSGATGSLCRLVEIVRSDLDHQTGLMLRVVMALLLAR